MVTVLGPFVLDGPGPAGGRRGVLTAGAWRGLRLNLRLWIHGFRDLIHLLIEAFG